MDALAFLGTMVRHDANIAVSDRSWNFHDLVWGRQGNNFEILVDVDLLSVDPRLGLFTHAVPDSLKTPIVRYSARVGLDPAQALRLISETLDFVEESGRVEFIANRTEDGKFYVRDPYGQQEKGVYGGMTYRAKSVLDQVPVLSEKDDAFVLLTELRESLCHLMTTINLDSRGLARGSEDKSRNRLSSDGSNLAYVIDAFKQSNPAAFADWIAHLRTALPDLADIRVVERPEDRYKYLMMKYDSGVEVPSWMTSDGTLRLLALTSLAYIPGLTGVYMIEEPETGIHPAAIETMCQSLRSVATAQILVATHSPVILNMMEPSELLCFSRDEDGATQVIRGDQHPALRNWKRMADLGDLLASGVLS
ncbi:AAA family ATPase [bacterium]|nr:AAA family ATPase [bacterium]